MPYKYNPFTGTLDDTTPGTVSAAASGTAAAPGISFSADPNTGIYNPGADEVAISTNGTEKARLTASGLLGIGASSVNDRLEVNGVIRSAITGSNTPSSVQGAYRFNNPLYPNQFAALYGYTIASSVDQIELAFLTSGSSGVPMERMRIKSTGVINFSNAPTCADNTAATAGGLAVGDVYQTVLGVLMIRY